MPAYISVPLEFSEAATSDWVPSELSPRISGASHRAVSMNPHQFTGSLSISNPSDRKLNGKCPKMLLTLSEQIPLLTRQRALLFLEAQ